MKTAVIGIGGVGGYMAGMLSSHTDHVTVVARGKRGESIREKGLILHSEYKGEITAHPEVVPSVAELPPQDIIFICVKNYSLEEVCRDLGGAVTEDTIIVPVMNGVDPGERIRNMLPGTIVADSLIYTVSFSRPDYSVCQQGQFTNLRIGIMNADEREKAAVGKVIDLLKAAEIDVEGSDDIQCEIWRKYVLNCAYNVATARHRTTIGPLRDDPKCAKEYECLVHEAYTVGITLGVHLKPEHEANIIDRFYHEHLWNAGSSLQRDVCAGAPRTEIETFSGYIVKTAHKLGLEVPVSEEYYNAMKEQGIR